MTSSSCWMLCSHFFLTLRSVFLRGLEEAIEHYFSLGIAAEINRNCLALMVSLVSGMSKLCRLENGKQVAAGCMKVKRREQNDGGAKAEMTLKIWYQQPGAWVDLLGLAATPELKWERTGPGASPPLALSPRMPIAVYPEVISSHAEKETGHPAGSLLESSERVEAGGEQVCRGSRLRTRAAPFASSQQAPVPGDRRCNERMGICACGWLCCQGW